MPDITILNALAVLGVILAIPHAYCIFDLIWLYFLRPSSVKWYLHGKAPYAIVTSMIDRIGKATAAELLTRGFNVILYGRNKAKMQKVVEELCASVLRMKGRSADIRYFITDTSTGSHDWVTLLQLFGHLHIIHNISYGYLLDTRTNERTEEYTMGIVHTNTLFALFLTCAVLPQLQRVAQSGPVQVLFIGSLASDTPPLRLPMLGASKGFLKALTWGLDNDKRFFSAPTGVSFTYLTVGAMHSDNHLVSMPPSLMVPTSARFAWSLVELIGCGQRVMILYLMHAVQYWLMEMLGERVVDQNMAQTLQEQIALAAKGK